MSTGGKQGSGAGPAAASFLVAGLVVAVVVMMIVPLPTWLVDILITLNIAASLTLLLAAAYARDALSIATFPTLLVLTTLFRLGLNVSTVRLILLQANAGEVVRAFGTFVVRGDYLVGGAVFLVLTIVQYVVIARGAERVAEVAARFTLDAMPGKQLAIDADLRAGFIDPAEAQKRRRTLSREAQLFGALDGAMRFVKGDAIAGILILIVALVGGLVTGTLRRGLSVEEAARVYSLLTIGDGLASQLPALLIATAAGLVVTRVASEEEGAVLGADIARQFLGRPAALFLVAGLLLLLALLPGLPILPFSLVALAFAGGAAFLVARPYPTVDVEIAASASSPSILLSLHPSIAARAGVADRFAPTSSLGRALDATSRAVVDDLGAPAGPVHVRVDASLPPRSYALTLRRIPVASGEVPDGDATALLCRVVDRALRQRAHELLGLDDVQRLLDVLARTCPTLVREVIPKRVDLPTLTGVLRRLLAEGIGIGELRDVLEPLTTEPIARDDEPATDGARDPAVLTEKIRLSLRGQITHRLAPDLTLRALLLDPLVEEAVRGAIRPGRVGQGQVLALEPAIADDIVAAVKRELDAHAASEGLRGDGNGHVAAAGPAGIAGPGARGPVIVTSSDLRRHLRRIVEADHPLVSVITWQELMPEVRVEPVGRISVGG